MPYTIFERKTPRLGSPLISFSKIGQIFFNQGAARILQKEPVEFILLLWDEVEHKLGIKSITNKKDPRAYKIHYNTKANGCSFSCKTFLDYTGINYAERKSLPVEINPNGEMLVEVKIPDSFFLKKSPSPSQPHLLGKTG
jgi:hypothetical protein